MKLTQRISKAGRKAPWPALWLVYDKIIGHKTYYLREAIPEMASGLRPKQVEKYVQLPNLDVTPGEFRYCEKFIETRG